MHCKVVCRVAKPLKLGSINQSINQFILSQTNKKVTKTFTLCLTGSKLPKELNAPLIRATHVLETKLNIYILQYIDYKIYKQKNKQVSETQKHK